MTESDIETRFDRVVQSSIVGMERGGFIGSLIGAGILMHQTGDCKELVSLYCQQLLSTPLPERILTYSGSSTVIGVFTGLVVGGLFGLRSRSQK